MAEKVGARLGQCTLLLRPLPIKTRIGRALFEPFLQTGADTQERNIGPLQKLFHKRHARNNPQGSQQRNRSPHRGKGCGARMYLAIFRGVKPSQHRCFIQRAKCSGVCNINKFNTAATVKPAEQRDFARAQWAAAVKPNDNRFRS